MLPDDVAFLTIPELGRRLRERAVTSAALVDDALARLDAEGRALGAVAALLADRARDDARAADRELAAGHDRGPLHGIPFGVKDCFAARGAPTTWGVPAYRDRVLAYDAAVVEKLRAAGAVLVAKLSMIELAGAGGYARADASLQGATRCPHDPGRWAGGSSSGPAAAVAAGLVPFAIGTETLGSILTPSAFCGVAGLRPTYGRVSRYGAMPCSWTMDKVGPLARSADDCALVLAAIAGPDARDPSALSTPIASTTTAHPRPLSGHRIAVVAPDFAVEGDREVGALFADAVAALHGLGADVTPAALPSLPWRAVAVAVYSSEAAAAHRSLLDAQGGFVDDAQRAGLGAAAAIPAVDYLDAQRLRRVMQRELDGFFAHYDAIAAPSRTTVAPPIDADVTAGRAGAVAHGGDERDVVAAGNVAGLPALSIPCGFTAAGLPAGLQLVAAPGREDVCLEIGAAYQAITTWHRRRPRSGGRAP